jgi:hypothetical protein
MLQKLKPGRLLRIMQVPTALHVNYYTTTLNCVHLNYTFSLAISCTKSLTLLLLQVLRSLFLDWNHRWW